MWCHAVIDHAKDSLYLLNAFLKWGSGWMAHAWSILLARKHFYQMSPCFKYIRFNMALWYRKALYDISQKKKTWLDISVGPAVAERTSGCYMTDWTPWFREYRVRTFHLILFKYPLHLAVVRKDLHLSLHVWLCFSLHCIMSDLTVASGFVSEPGCSGRCGCFNIPTEH